VVAGLRGSRFPEFEVPRFGGCEVRRFEGATFESSKVRRLEVRKFGVRTLVVQVIVVVYVVVTGLAILFVLTSRGFHRVSRLFEHEPSVAWACSGAPRKSSSR
jgi:hypothetical protein